MFSRKSVQAVCAGIGVMLFGSLTHAMAAQYDHEVQDQKISFAWKVDGDKLDVKLSAQTTGWVGIGFNPSRMMKDAQFVLGFVKDGKVEITDDFGDSTTSHGPDEKMGGTSDVTVVGGSEEGGKTTIEFTMPLKSADKHDTEIKLDGDTTVLLAYGGSRDSFRQKHHYRTELKVNLSTGAFHKAD